MRVPNLPVAHRPALLQALTRTLRAHGPRSPPLCACQPHSRQRWRRSSGATFHFAGCRRHGISRRGVGRERPSATPRCPRRGLGSRSQACSDTGQSTDDCQLNAPVNTHTSFQMTVGNDRDTSGAFRKGGYAKPYRAIPRDFAKRLDAVELFARE